MDITSTNGSYKDCWLFNHILGELGVWVPKMGPIKRNTSTFSYSHLPGHQEEALSKLSAVSFKPGTFICVDRVVTFPSYTDLSEGRALVPQCWCLTLWLTQKQYGERSSTSGTLFAGENKMTRGTEKMVMLSSSSRCKFFVCFSSKT